MTAITIFPNIKNNGSPYINDFLEALRKSEGASIANEPHKNPLASLLLKKNQGDVFVFNWFESIPDYKYGWLQAIVAVFFILFIKWRGKKIVWILHNKKPHAKGYKYVKAFLGKLIAKLADLIITHSKEGIEVVKKNYPYAVSKVHFLHHPTKDRMTSSETTVPLPQYDLLVWGTISRYKGVVDFVEYLRRHPKVKYKVCILGECATTDLYNELAKNLPSHITFIHRKASFKELEGYIAQSRFVLNPYFSESILSSGILMDSLSLGAKVIGPDTGSFKDYAEEPLLKVYTFKRFDDIASIVDTHKEVEVSRQDYKKFLQENDWGHFIRKFLALLNE